MRRYLAGFAIAAFILGMAQPAAANTGGSVALVVNSIERSPNGVLAWDVVINSSGLGPDSGPCAGYGGCELYFEGKKADGTVLTLNYLYLQPEHEFNKTTSFTGGTYAPYLSHVRASLKFNGVVALQTPWEASNDHFPEPSVNLGINSLTRDSAGVLAWDVTVATAGLGEGQGPCAGYGGCELYFEGKKADGTVLTLNYLYLAKEHEFGKTTNFTGSTQAVELTDYRATVRFKGVEVLSTELAASSRVSGGHDLDASAALIIAAVGTDPLGACLAAFPKGTHKYQSSVNDQQMDCLSATNSGKTFASFITGYVGTLSPKLLKGALVAAGAVAAAETAATSLKLDYNQADLPAGCTFSSLVTIACTFGSELVTHRPITAPPQQDPVWQANQRLKAQQDRITSGEAPPVIPAPLPGVAPGPLDNATVGDIDTFVAEACVAYLYKWGEAAGLSDNACDTMPIFATGMEYAEASQHDLDAIESNPSWFALSYVTVDEKRADGNRRDWYRGVGNCAVVPAGNDCDEFPYFASEQGGKFTTAPDGAISPLVSLRPLNSTHNRSQGAAYGGFITKCKLGSVPRGDAKRNFLVVPVPVLPTTKLCGVR